MLAPGDRLLCLRLHSKQENVILQVKMSALSSNFSHEKEKQIRFQPLCNVQED